MPDMLNNTETPGFAQASVAVDLGAESCRVSLLRWIDGKPQQELVHRFGNGPVQAADGTLRWPIGTIVQGVEHGLRLCAERAPEGIQSIGVDGWAVDYVRVDAEAQPLEDPFCYRDERNLAAQDELHQRISPERLLEITGLQLQPLNTLYQLRADRLAGKPAGAGWLNLPEYFLARWSGERVSEFTLATHTEMIDLTSREWSGEILAAAEIDASTMPRIVPPGTILGPLQGSLAGHAAFANTQIIAPACHDTASAILGVPALGDDWAYISSGTWSLVGIPVDLPRNNAESRRQGFTNLGLDGDRLLLQKNMNGMWLLKQCMDSWAAEGKPWEIAALCDAARNAPAPDTLLDVDDPELLRMGDMPQRINAQLARRNIATLDESSAGAPAIATLIFHSLAAQFTDVLTQVESLSGRAVKRVYVVGGGSRNRFLLDLLAAASGKEVLAGSPESSTVGNFAVQLAALDPTGDADRKRELVATYAATLIAASV